MTATAQTIELATELLTAQQEAFARGYVEYRNASTAYRLAYNVGHNTQPQHVWESGSRLLANPKVRTRVTELEGLAAAQTIVRARDILQDQVDLATADANDLIRVESRNCRHCYGVGHAYQWQELEWAHKAAEAMDAESKPPSDAGGMGYDPKREPNPDCPHCYGAGVRVVFVTDSAKLTGKARRLYRGVKLGAKGDLEVLMEDRADARDKATKMLGAYQTEGKVGELGLPPPADVPVDASLDPTDGYMAMVQRPATR